MITSDQARFTLWKVRNTQGVPIYKIYNSMKSSPNISLVRANKKGYLVPHDIETFLKLCEREGIVGHTKTIKGFIWHITSEYSTERAESLIQRQELQTA